VKIFLPFLCLLLLSSCTNEVPSERLVERNGFYYEVNSELPYTGSTEYYHENGQLGSKDNWKDGKREGPSEYYHENGQLSSKGNWKNGEIDGLSVVYFENGQLEFKVKFKMEKKMDFERITMKTVN